MKQDMIYPDADGPRKLMHEVQVIFMQIPFVSYIYVFGSLARGDADRWSDVDVLIVTQTQPQYRDAWARLHHAKPILYHHPFTAVDASAGHALGNVFVDESVFHCLDLNFLTVAAHADPTNLARFGKLHCLYKRAERVPPSNSDNGDFIQVLTPDIERISVGLHFTKKHIKKVLRGESVRAELRKWRDHLRTVMDDFPPDYRVVSGSIGQIATQYLEIADYLLGHTP